MNYSTLAAAGSNFEWTEQNILIMMIGILLVGVICIILLLRNMYISISKELDTALNENAMLKGKVVALTNTVDRYNSMYKELAEEKENISKSNQNLDITSN